jgi:cyanophycinase-like exopeptidase
MRTKKGHDPVLQAVFRRTGVPKPAVAYIGAASGDNAEFRLWLTALMKQSGAGRVTLAPLCGRRGDAQKAEKVIEASDLIFLSGGDVEEGMQVLRQKKMTGVLDHYHRAGKPFFATSAGSIMLARQWIRWDDPADDQSAVLFDCLGLASVVCDTHGEDEGWEELKALLRLSAEGTIGHGIVSGAALSVSPSGVISAMGGEIHRFQNQGGHVIQVDSLLSEPNAS